MGTPPNRRFHPAALLVGALARGALRIYFLLALSVLAVYWFQPVIPLRSFDFWLPSLSLASDDSHLAHHIAPRRMEDSPKPVCGLLSSLDWLQSLISHVTLFPPSLFTATIPPISFSSLWLVGNYDLSIPFHEYHALTHGAVFCNHLIDRNSRHSQISHPLHPNKHLPPHPHKPSHRQPFHLGLALARFFIYCLPPHSRSARPPNGNDCPNSTCPSSRPMLYSFPHLPPVPLTAPSASHKTCEKTFPHAG